MYLNVVSFMFDRFCDDIEYMTNKRPRIIWMWCWKIISPLTIVVVLLFSIWSLSKNTPKYDVWDRATVNITSASFLKLQSPLYPFPYIYLAATH